MKFPTSNLLLCCFLLLYFPFSNTEESKNGSSGLPIFEEHLIVPYIFPSSPRDYCGVIYKPRAIIATGKFYFPYQVEGMPEISWDFEYNKFYTLIAIEAIQKRNLAVTTTTENVHFLGVLKKVYEDPTTSNSTKNISTKKPENDRSPPEQWWFRWVVVDIEENDIDSGMTLQQPLSLCPTVLLQPNSTHQIVFAFAIFEQSKKFGLDGGNEESFTQQLLKTNFTPLANFAEDFHGKNSLIFGNFFYVVPKPHVIVDNSPVQKIRWLTK